MVPTAAAAEDHRSRAARAREVLARAELRTGARSLALGTRPGTPAAVTAVPAPAPSVPPAPSAPSGPSSTALPTALLTTERPPLAVPPALVPLLPEGLRRGGATVVTGSTSLLLALLAQASAGGAWAAVVGQPSIGLLAAAQAGVELDRLALVPRPGADSPAVVAALVDGLDVVVVGAGAVLTDADRRRLTARVRERGAVLLTSTAWPGATAVLDARPLGWTGLADGEGHLRSHRLQVRRTGRGAAPGDVGLELELPLPVPGALRVAPAAPSVPQVVPQVASQAVPQAPDEGHEDADGFVQGRLRLVG
ncbi:hypothetical protein SAMN05421867_11272 [Cellulomonas marina]|uniref:Uncharacterized protein n=1 Tax=Cellulomonas marina TaxID=988821 RepID=A0A1I0ZV19_9CELL|nr:hypothetical protein SAMN05421867_11272 [Cellulomonas marina]